MTDSVTTPAAARGRASDKRERLVRAAAELLHRQGVERTSLAEIAKAAGVPVGNVYYWFKTKDELVAAVVTAHTELARAVIDAIEAKHHSPRARLKAFVRQLAEPSEILAQHGCPVGSLCSEIDKRTDPSAFPVGALMQLPIDWVEGQFRELGRSDAHDLAVELVAGYQGSVLIANTLRDPEVVRRTSRRLERWIDAA